MDFLQLSLNDEIVVDNFAGGGGASTGMEIALGRSVDIAINHDPEAIAMHRANHPNTYHYCEDVWDVDPVEACAGRQVALCWFSPDCKHFSRAKGGKPVDKNIRGLAWVAIRWAEKVKPRVIMLENVEEFQTWGPLLNNRPDPKHTGETFHQFVAELEGLGYAVSFRTLVAADYGAPTTRKRFFLIARRDQNEIVWPDATHGDPDNNILVQCGKLKPWRAVAEVLNFELPTPSIFDRKHPLCEKTMKRIAEGYQKFVSENPRPYLIQYHDGHFRGQQIERPLHTITTHDRFGLVTVKSKQYQMIDIGMRMLTPRELFDAQGFPHDYIIDHDYTGKEYPKTAQVARCGNAVPPPLPAALVRANLPDLCNANRKRYGLYADKGA